MRPNGGATNEWQTPPEVVKAIGCYDDDPARPGMSDGLERDWNGFVWLNPPYGKNIGQWMARMKQHGNGIALVFARTETAWFHDSVWAGATAVFFPRGRIRFYLNGQRARFTGGGPSVFIAYGMQAYDRLKLLGLHMLGRFVDLRG